MYRTEKIADMCIPCHKVPLTFLAAVTIPAELPEEKVETTHALPLPPTPRKLDAGYLESIEDSWMKTVE